MKTLEWSTINKSQWPDGPWLREPDKRQWQDEETGLACLIVRHTTSGHLCGYVGVPESHPLHGKGYSDSVPEPDGWDKELIGKRGIIPVLCQAHGEAGVVSIDCLFDVHGSITFAGPCRGESDPSKNVCHVREDGDPEVWWFGFDMAHLGDASPVHASPFGDDETYRDFGYAAGECASLARQLAAYPSPAVERPSAPAGISLR